MRKERLKPLLAYHILYIDGPVLEGEKRYNGARRGSVNHTIGGSLSEQSISVIIPVYREQEAIADVINHLRRLEDSGPGEIIVVDGEPDQSTIASLRVDGVRRVAAEQGRAVQMNRGAALASGDVLLFLHADTFLPPNALSLVRRALSDRECVAGAFALGFDADRPIFRITERYVALRTRMTRIPFGDQAIFIRRGYFEALGGYTNIPLMEDVDLMRRIRRRGDRIALVPAKVKTSPRRYEQEGILRATLRNLALQFLFTVGVPPERLARWYKNG